MTRAVSSFVCAVVLALVACGGSASLDPQDLAGGGDAGVATSPWAAGWRTGSLSLPQLDRIAFAPDGTLFLTDGVNGKLAVVELPAAAVGDAASNHFDELAIGTALADALGGGPNVEVVTLRVHPLSHRVFLVARRGNQTALLSVDGGGQVRSVDLGEVRHVVVDFATDADGSFVSDLEVTSKYVIASIANANFSGGHLLTVPVPVGAEAMQAVATTRTYHRTHQGWEESETFAPVDQLLVFEDADPPLVAASYICAPVVRLPLAALAAGGKVTGETPFDLGPGRQVLDMLAYARDGVPYILTAYLDGISASLAYVRIARELIEQRDAINARAPIVVDGAGVVTDERVTRQPQLANTAAMALRDPTHFVTFRRDGRLATRELP